jgi:hypothetical protein
MTTPKKKLNRADYMFNQKKDEVLVKKPGDIGGLDFAIRYLEGCNVSLYDMCAQVS